MKHRMTALDFWSAFFGGMAGNILLLFKDVALKNTDLSRQEDKKDCEAAELLIKEIKYQAHTFWSRDANILSNENNIIIGKIHLLFSDLSPVINRLQSSKMNSSHFYLKFKQKVTGSNFDNRERKSDIDLASIGIPEAAANLIGNMGAEYSQKYRKKPLSTFFKGL